MKRKSLLLGLISLILALPAQSQIVTKYQQGFETGESVTYGVTSGTASPITTLYSSGSRSLKLQHGSQETIVQLDTIDFTDNGSFTSYYLEFMHICDVDPMTCGNPTEVATIEARLAHQTEWTVLGDLYVDDTWGGGSSYFHDYDSYSERAYDIWQGATPNNSWWKRERFKLANVLNEAPLEQKKIIIRFRLKPRTSAGSTNEGWYFDNITVKCSPISMALPVATMIAYPDQMDYPQSRGARIEASINTTVAAGMDPDSIYVVYQLGSSAPIRRTNMATVPGQANRYIAYIPFCGYDTIVNWRLVAKDMSLNHNATTFPQDETGWNQYRSVRGKNTNNEIASTNQTSNLFPFGNLASYKSEMVYSREEMEAAGYGPGAITQIGYQVASTVQNSQHSRFVVQMRNLPEDYTMSATNNFNTEFARTVYDSSLSITQNNGTTGIINLQDTFYYAGGGLLVRMTFAHVSDPSALSIKMVPAADNSGYGTLYRGYSIAQHFDPFTSTYFKTGAPVLNRPNFIFNSIQNMPLLYDCGISGFVTPNDSVTADAVGNNDVIVTLKNYGALPINAVRIYYSVDNGAAQYYDWSGNLAGGASTNVTINSTQTYSVGYHEMMAWVDDSVTSNSIRYRDHEPLNDSLWTRFVACDGPMSGTRYVGGSTPDYQTLEKFLYAASLCGVNGPLTVKLAPGTYRSVVFPSIPGTSASNYVSFEPSNGGNTVTFEALNEGENLTTTPYLVNLQQANHIRFKRINFSSGVLVSNSATYHVRMGINSTGCQFDSCTFTESASTAQPTYTYATALIYSGGCDSLKVSNSQFSRARTGISLVGPASDNMAHGSIVQGNSFINQGVNGVIIRNQVNAVVDSNNFNDVYANSSYVILLQDCSGATKVTRNTVYVTSGASCLGATGFIGDSANNALIANNMLISNDNGTSNMLTTPLNIINADYTKVYYNSIKLVAPTRSGIAAATFGGTSINHSRFYNNIVACFDTVNFAFSYIPSQGSSNLIGYNIYYSKGPVLNKYDGINCFTLANWQGHCAMDANSQNVDPSFLNSTNTDLRSYSQNVKGHAIPFPEVTVDIFGNPRDAAAPCIGAFEFAALPYDFEIIEFIEPYTDYCDNPSAAPLRVVIKNSGINTYDPTSLTTPMQLTYSRGTAPGVMTPGFSGNIPVNITIPASDTVTFNTGVTIPFPPNGMNDTTYQLFVWLTSTIDPNPANDTSSMTVTSRYHAPAPNNVQLSINYGNSATLTVTGGLQTWYSNIFTQSTAHQSEVYWYTSPTSTTPIWRGHTFTTDPLYTDTCFYIRQKRDFPLMKITEVQLKNNQPGVTYPMPLWMNGATTFAIEMTNVGDYPADLEGDTLHIVSSQSSFNNKYYRFPQVTIQPGQSIVIQYRGNITTSDSTVTLGTATLSPNLNTNLGILYRSKGVIEDAVAINSITTANQWTNQNVPNVVWAGSGITIPDTVLTAGIFRHSWPTTNSPSNSQQYWTIADNEHRMTLGTTNRRLIRYEDNGCEGDMATACVSLINLPAVDLVVDSLDLASGCSIGVNPLTVTISNRGAQPSGQVVAHYRVTSQPLFAGQAQTLQVCADTISNIAGLNTAIQHTFSIPVDYTVTTGSVNFNVLVWVEKNTNDNTSFNDTASAEIVSAFTPGVPNVYSYDTVNYGDRAILQAISTNDSLAWYDRYMNPLDTVNVYTTGYLYADDTFYVTSFGTRENLVHVGSLSSTNAASAYPSPYNPNKKYIKEQYLFLAEDLIEAGHSAGPINSVSFYLDTILGPGSMTLTDYVVSMGTTTDATFGSNTAWHTVTAYSTIDTLQLSNADKGWVKHPFNSVFQWDGVSNIVVQVTRAIDPNISQGAKTRYTNAGNNKVLYKNGTTSMVDVTTAGTRSANRPDIRFGFVGLGCEGPAAPVYITIVGTPPADAALSWPDGSDTMTFSSCGNIDIDVNLRNLGSAPFSSYSVDYWIDGVQGVHNGTTTLASQQSQDITIAQPSLTPGRHTLLAIVNVANDTVHTNDTISKTINVRFCAGTYTIGTTGLFPDFHTAIDTLVNAGIDGPVVFSVLPGSYNEQINIGAVDGVSATNTITFRGSTPDSSDVVVYYAPVQNANYVVNIDGAQYLSLENMTFYGRGASNFSNVISIANSSNVRLRRDVIRVKGTINNLNASAVIVGEGVHFLYIDSSWIDSGYYSVRSMVPDGGSDGMFFSENKFTNFWYTGVYLRKVNDVYLVHNTVTSGVNINSRTLTGIFVAEHSGPVTVERNFVSLSDNRTGGKRGIHLVNVNGSNAIRSHVYNNMTSVYSKGTAGLVSSGISIDSSSWVNVYFNSCQVYVTPTTSTTQTTRAFSVETTSSGIFAMNNIFSNLSGGYAMYIRQAANISNTNYNGYWSSSQTRLAYIGAECANMTELLALNTGRDLNSVNRHPYFIAPDDLHLSVGSFCELAQYNTEVPIDIDGNNRPQIPNPTMGAHEFERPSHNVAILDVLTPSIDIELGVTDNVESDSLHIKVRFTNDGTSTETNLIWWAEVDNTNPLLQSSNRTIDELMPQEEIIDSTFILMPIGIIDTQYLTIHLILNNDMVPENNTLTIPFFLDPAYNFKTDSVAVFRGDGCRKQQTPVQVYVKNVGRKTLPAGIPITIGFQGVLQTSGVTVSTLPTTWTETVTLPADIPVNASAPVSFNQTANLYPTGISRDIVVRCRAWITYEHDQKPLNDTSNYISVTSKYTPSSPVGVDLHIPYATWDTIFASHTDVPPVQTQDAHRPIRWYRDSTAAPFYTSNNYAMSCWWETPQYFHDSTYYLSCISSSNCTSYYSPVHVFLNPRVPVDMAVLNVVEPQANMVYMLDDSVKLSLINYGSQAVSNIPVVYQLYSPTNQLLQEVREVCTATIQPDEVYVFKFDSLIHIPTWSWTTPYTIRAWTDMANEGVRLNDTLRERYSFMAKPDDAYVVAGVSAKAGLDITRVAYSSMDNSIAPVGHTYINFVNATSHTENVDLGDNVLVSAGAVATPDLIAGGVQDYGGNASVQNVGDLRALHVIKGTTDTMIIECANSDRSNDFETGAWVSVYIDQDRDGYFLFFPQGSGDSIDYSYPYTEIVYHDSIKSNRPLRFALTIPETMRTGYTRMRIVLNQSATKPTDAQKAILFGQFQDYLLYVEDEPTAVDVSPARIESPSSPFIGGYLCQNADEPVTVTFRMANKGNLAVNSALVTYHFIHPNAPEEPQVIQWAGNLDRGHSVNIDLPPHVFPEGTTALMIVTSVDGDTNTVNDTLWTEFNRAPVRTLYYDEHFDNQDLMYAPRGFTAFTKNMWQRGYPQKANIMACVSDSNVWATNLTGFVNGYQVGNQSILYTPVFDISQIRSDTISVWVATQMEEGHSLRIEYLNYQNRWVTMGSGNDDPWYNSGIGWTGTNDGFTQYKISTSMSAQGSINGDFQQSLRLRFIYTAQTESNACDGAAIDDLFVGRQRRNIDVGVISIIYPTEPRFGQIISPKVVLYNYGLDTIRSVSLAYMPYGSFLPKTGLYESEEGIAPNGTAVFTFPTPFVVRNDFPDTFSICAYTTVNVDLYHDNDSICSDFYLSPLDNDMAMVSFLSPLDRVIAGDSISVTTRIRNYGQQPVETTRLTYVYNNSFTVTEEINFNEVLGRPLESFEYFNYTFHQKYRASMGMMNLQAYIDMAADDYVYNDTISKRIDGLSAIVDLKAREILVDTSTQNIVRIQLVVDNVGALGVSDFDMGFWYYNDTNTLVTAHYHSDTPVPALSSLYYIFDTILPRHNEYYRSVTAFVHADNDNDNTNDTTTNIAIQYVDLRPIAVEVEENREETCNVRMRFENVGNITSTRPVTVEATINGTTIRRGQVMMNVAPGQIYHVDFNATVPKSNTRSYVGTGEVRNSDDVNASNNQTSVIEVLNYFEGIPFADAANGMELKQNYPNPFDNSTRIDFYLPVSGSVTFFVMDELGRLVYQKVETYGAGEQSVIFQESSLSSGVYYYGIEMNGERLMRKMVLKR